MKVNKKIVNIALICTVILLGIWFMKDFNFSWVEVNESGAKITINFILPMEKDKLEEAIKIHTQVPYADSFHCKITWKTNHTAIIELKECSQIKGQKVIMQIDKAPTKYVGIQKHASIKIQFQTPVVILEPTKETLIATQNPFYIKFNTPMKKNSLHKYLQSDGEFYITPVMLKTHDGKQLEDPTFFEFKPKSVLENEKNYILSFRQGMPAQSGVLLENNLNIALKTDKKPKIIQTYPKEHGKWIGFYPNFVIETDKPIVSAILQLGNMTVKGKLKGDYGAEFLLPGLLKSNTEYEAIFTAQAPSGELSIPEKIVFTTAPVNEETIWIEITTKNNANLKVYKGKKVIKTMSCSVGKEKTATPLGTYYAQEKGEKFFSHRYNEGANYWIKVSGDTLIQGITRDEYWNIKQGAKNNLGKMNTHGNIVLDEEDAKWLYDHLPKETMITIHE